jgi:hypothetical protein
VGHVSTLDGMYDERENDKCGPQKKEKHLVIEEHPGAASQFPTSNTCFHKACIAIGTAFCSDLRFYSSYSGRESKIPQSI